MKAAEERWSRHVWFWGFLFLFLSHAFAVFYLGERRSVTRSGPKPGAFLYLSGAPDTDQRVAEHTAYRDPTLFAVPHPHSFSGGAWLNFQPELPRLSNWTAPPEWLTLRADQLGQSLNDYVATNRPSEEPLLVSLRGRAAPEVRIPDPPILTRSTVKVEGTLATRRLLFVPGLTNVPHNDVLSKTVIAIAANEHGIVESASIAKDSGSKFADGSALTLARSFTFEALALPRSKARGITPPAFGRLVFTWNAVPATNQGPAAANAQ